MVIGTLLKTSALLFLGMNENLNSFSLISGCRADANEAAMVLLPSNITVFTLDFSGSGLSDGDYVSLGWHEVCVPLSLLTTFITLS